jgi:hypothetical protein
LEIESVVVAYDRRNLGQRLAIRLKDFLADSAQSRPICPGIVGSVSLSVSEASSLKPVDLR